MTIPYFLIRGFRAYLPADDFKRAVVNLGNDHERTMFEVAQENMISLIVFLDLIENRRGKQIDVTFEDWREPDQCVYISKIFRAKTYLDWELGVSLADESDRFLDRDEQRVNISAEISIRRP